MTPRTLLGRASAAFAAGCLGGLANSLAVWGLAAAWWLKKTGEAD